MSLPTDEEDICEIVDVKDDGEFLAFLDTAPTGVALRASCYGESETPVLKSSSGDFAKWIQTFHPETRVSLPENADRLLLHSGDVWLPLAFLASDITLPIFLNLVASYLYDRLKGKLRGEAARVHLSVEYRDRKAGKTKLFNFAGDSQTLKDTIKKMDLNRFFDEEPSE